MADDVDPLVPRPLDRLRNAPFVADLSVSTAGKILAATRPTDHTGRDPSRSPSAR
jgi:hypothetical protein